MADGSFTGLRLSGLRGPRWHLRLAHDERAPLRPLRSAGLRQPLPAHARPSGAADVSLATAGEADGRGPRRGPRLDLSGLASRATPGATGRTGGGPSRAARPRRRAATGAARRALRELQRAQGPEPAAKVTGCQAGGRYTMPSRFAGDSSPVLPENSSSSVSVQTRRGRLRAVRGGSGIVAHRPEAGS